MKLHAPVEIVHQASPGRMRVKVFAIYRKEALKTELESRIEQIDYVQSARGNVLTGNILINFDPSRTQVANVLSDLESLCGTLECAISAPPAPPPSPSARRSKGWLAALFVRGQEVRESGAAQSVQVASAKLHRSARPTVLPPLEPWHARTAAASLDLLGSSEAGLSGALVADRFERYGPNVLCATRQRPAYRIFFEQFLNIPVAMLGVSAVISMATGGVADAIVIGGVVLINAAIGYFTESAAERTINTLSDLTPASAWVIRDGVSLEVPVAEVVVGDALLLMPGAFVPADARLIAGNRLSVDESALTGESLPVAKRHDKTHEPSTPLGERANMVHMGTVVTGGNGLAVVTATGAATEIGQIQALVGEVATPDTPMQRQLDQMGVKLAALSAGICALVFGIGIVRGLGWLQMLNSSISLAVAAVPEGLPAVATTTLALGIREMQRRQVLIRQLPAVESLGSVQVLCLDKTGTLTMNQMKVVAVHTERHAIELQEGMFRDRGQICRIPAHAELQRLFEVVSLCSEVRLSPREEVPDLDGSPTECALVEAALQAGLDVIELRSRLPQIRLEHRAENRPYMLSSHLEPDGRYFIAVKGSPGEVLGLCVDQQIGEERRFLDDAARQKILSRNEAMASEALRVLGVAYGHADSVESGIPHDLVWLGLIAMEDVMRPGMPELMAQFHAAGIETVMITGDQSATAYSMGKRLGLNHNRNLEIVDSLSLDRVEPEILASVVKDTTIFSRVSPAHKLRIVQALQSSGRVIAMTGDGINDGPALKAADVGVAMGKHGTDVARSVADVVLQDDNLHTMITAVEQGRTIYSNIRKSLRFLLSTNLSEIEVMLVTTALGFGEALNPMQLLWINLVTDIFPALALAVEPPERDVLKQAPRDPAEPIIGRKDMARLVRESAIITAGSLGVYAFSLARHGAGQQASTNTFMTLTLAQLLQSLACRSEDTTVLDGARPRNPYLRLAIAGSIGVQALTLLVPPLRGLLRLTPVSLVDLLAILAGTGLPFLVNEGSKQLRISRDRGLQTT